MDSLLSPKGRYYEGGSVVSDIKSMANGHYNNGHLQGRVTQFFWTKQKGLN